MRTASALGTSPAVSAQSTQPSLQILSFRQCFPIPWSFGACQGAWINSVDFVMETYLRNSRVFHRQRFGYSGPRVRWVLVVRYWLQVMCGKSDICGFVLLQQQC